LAEEGLGPRGTAFCEALELHRVDPERGQAAIRALVADVDFEHATQIRVARQLIEALDGVLGTEGLDLPARDRVIRGMLHGGVPGLPEPCLPGGHDFPSGPVNQQKPGTNEGCRRGCGTIRFYQMGGSVNFGQVP
jgi:hypothetical protein